MNFKRYYQHQCCSMFGILQLYNICAICINVSLSITEFDAFNQIVIRVDICIIIWYNLDGVDRITVGIDVYGMLNFLTFAIDILIKKSIWISFSYVLAIIFDEIASNSDKQGEFERDYRNNTHTTIVTYNVNKIHSTPIAVAFCVDICHSILPVMDRSPLKIELPIEFDSFVAAIDQLMLNFGVPLLIDTVSFHIQVIYNVCAVSSSLFSFVCNF